MDPAEIPLRDIHLPKPISWWPPAPGWWLTIGAIIIAIIAAVLYWKWYNRHRIKRSALNELQNIESSYNEHRDTHRLAQELSRLARRAALATDPSRTAAAETGAAWSARLNTLSKSGDTAETLKSALERAPYRREESINADTALRAFRLWLVDLRVPGKTQK
ncbi:MAG TPA: hypothetical protein DGR97_07190 [Gammaproteobacteria bacterium]|nr:hypothetical protein [Gammaproteobacteria bacterium]|tara:strand:+ start:539 stop:1024 length:486 start_codon:yes stop_codon:yes gene_type:complete